jgi:hypothetical protein
MSREQLAEAIREEKLPKVCLRHDEPVYFDGKHCPCCLILRENFTALMRPKTRLDRSTRD